MAKSSYGQGDSDKGKQRWIDSTLDARHSADIALQECTHPSIGNNQCIDVHEVVVSLNASLMRYRNHIAAKAQQLTVDNWDSAVCDVNIPQEGRYDAGLTDEWGEYDLSGIWHRIDWDDYPVIPASLREDWGGGKEIEIELLLDAGGTRDTRVQTVYLPPNACGKVFEFLDLCLENLGWLPEAAEIDVHSTEVLR